MDLKMRRSPLWTIFLINLSYKCVISLYMHVDANAEECIYQKLEANMKIDLIFEVVEGGFLDIDLRVLDPNGHEMYKGQRESNGKYKFTAHQPGKYMCCFGNTMSTMTPKIVMFTFEKEEHKNFTSESDDDKHRKLEGMVQELVINMENVKRDQDFMEARDKIHRAINQNTNSRVVMWSLFEALVLIAMTVGQIYYLKRFFEVRRVI